LTLKTKTSLKNNYPDRFDKYTGNYNYSGDLNEKYHLLTYKDTKIVHTLFPDKKLYNRKRKLQFGKGIVTSELKFPIGHSDLRVPYENSQGTVAYSILIRKYFEEQVERTFIQRYDHLGNPADVYLIGDRAIEGFEPFDRPIMYRYQYTDLSDYEAIIRQIDESYLPSKA
jgi:hypothetical protein